MIHVGKLRIDDASGTLTLDSQSSPPFRAWYRVANETTAESACAIHAMSMLWTSHEVKHIPRQA